MLVSAGGDVVFVNWTVLRFPRADSAQCAAAVLHALTLPRTAEITDIHIRPLHNAR